MFTQSSPRDSAQTETCVQKSEKIKTHFFLPSQTVDTATDKNTGTLSCE